jgi:hypothetical protein
VKASVTNSQSRNASNDYDVTPDGRVLVGMATPDLRTPPAPITLNWTQALKESAENRSNHAVRTRPRTAAVRTVRVLIQAL